MILIYITAILILTVFFFYTIPFKTILDRRNSIWKGNSQSIYLTFDDGPNRKITPYILDELKRFNQKATFFLIPEYITKDNEFLVKRILDEGHTIGLHGSSCFLSFNSIRFLNKYIDDFNIKITEIVGKKYLTKLFRPPSLWRSPWLYTNLEKNSIQLVGVSGFCWLDQWTNNSNIMIKRFTKLVKKGSIYILHDGSANSYEPEMPMQKLAITDMLGILESLDIESVSL